MAEEGVTALAPYLKFVWNIDIDSDTEGEQTVTYVPVADLVVTYSAGDYISISNNAISVDYETLKSKINTELVSPVSVKVSTLETNYNTLNTTVTNITTNVESITVKDVDTSVSNGVNLSLDDAGKIGINVDIDTLADAVIDKHVVELDADSIKTTEAIGDNAAGASVQDVLADLNNIIDQSVVSVVSGSGISVDVSDVNNPTVSVNIAEGSSLRASADGLDLVWEELS